MVRKREGRSEKRATSGKNRLDDFYKIRIIKFLSSCTEASKAQLQEKGEYGIGPMNRTDLRIIMEKMFEKKWITRRQDDHSKNVTLWALTEKGRKMADMIRNTDDEHPLFDLDAFRNVKSLGTLNE